MKARTCGCHSLHLGGPEGTFFTRRFLNPIDQYHPVGSSLLIHEAGRGHFTSRSKCLQRHFSYIDMGQSLAQGKGAQGKRGQVRGQL